MLYFYINTCLNLFNISFLFSGRRMISSTGSCFTILSSLDLVTVSAILFPKNSHVLWTTFLEAVTRASIPASSNCFLYFLVIDKNPYILTYFLVLGSLEYHRIGKIEERVIFIY